MKITDDIKIAIVIFFISAVTILLIWVIVMSCDGVFKVNDKIDDLSSRVVALETGKPIAKY